MGEDMGNDKAGAPVSAEYIERMCAELGRMAEQSGLPVLAYLLDMAREEAGLSRNAATVSSRPLPGGDGRMPRPGHGAARR